MSLPEIIKQRTLTIYGELTDLNAYIKALNSHYHAGNAIKRDETDRVRLSAQFEKMLPVKKYPVSMTFSWYSKNERKDIDNVAFAKKFILDGLVEAGVLENDGRKQVAGFTDRFFIDK